MRVSHSMQGGFQGDSHSFLTECTAPGERKQLSVHIDLQVEGCVEGGPKDLWRACRVCLRPALTQSVLCDCSRAVLF